MILGIDGNVIDMATVCLGFAGMLIRPVRCKLRGDTAWNRQHAVTDFLNGSSLVPFALIVGSTFWSWMLEEALKSKASLSLAGGVGLFFVMAEVFNAGKAP